MPLPPCSTLPSGCACFGICCSCLLISTSIMLCRAVTLALLQRCRKDDVDCDSCCASLACCRQLASCLALPCVQAALRCSWAGSCPCIASQTSCQMARPPCGAQTSRQPSLGQRGGAWRQSPSSSVNACWTVRKLCSAARHCLLPAACVAAVLYLPFAVLCCAVLCWKVVLKAAPRTKCVPAAFVLSPHSLSGQQAAGTTAGQPSAACIPLGFTGSQFSSVTLLVCSAYKCPSSHLARTLRPSTCCRHWRPQLRPTVRTLLHEPVQRPRRMQPGLLQV
jgi:hypothetical protein